MKQGAISRQENEDRGQRGTHLLPYGAPNPVEWSMAAGFPHSSGTGDKAVDLNVL